MVSTPSFTRMRSSGNWNSVYSLSPFTSWFAGLGWLIAFVFVWLVFEMRNLFQCLHFEMISDLLLRRIFRSVFMMQSFSSIQRLHLFVPIVKRAAALFTMVRFMPKDRFFVFMSHMYFDSSVSLEYFLSSKDLIWFLYWRNHTKQP